MVLLKNDMFSVDMFTSREVIFMAVMTFSSQKDSLLAAAFFKSKTQRRENANARERSEGKQIVPEVEANCGTKAGFKRK